jgi:hypothetical protein
MHIHAYEHTCTQIDTVKPACLRATDRWWEVSREIETDFGLPTRERCGEGGYESFIQDTGPSSSFSSPSSSSVSVSPAPPVIKKLSRLQPALSNETSIPSPLAYPGATVAVAITVLNVGNNFMDGTAVLATSVRLAARNSKYTWALVSVPPPL